MARMTKEDWKNLCLRIDARKPAEPEDVQPAHDPLAGIREEADGSFTDERTGLTLEFCEKCGDLDYPSDPYTGRCSTCSR